MTSTGGKTILVVDDIQENIDLISLFLRNEPYTIVTANSGEQALELIEKDRPDLVLLDVMMPGIDGIEVCRRIKREAGKDPLPVVMVTAHGAPKIKREGLEAGAEDFLSKPIEREDLIARIRNLLRSKKLFDDLSRSYEHIDREVEAIAALQRSLLPASQPDLPSIAIFDFYQPSRKAGGDYFDFVEIDDHRLGIAVGDVSGHGPQASVLMAMLKMTLHLCPECWQHPRELLAKANEHLMRFVPSGEFITLFYGVLDLDARSLTFSSAGHCPPVLISARNPEPRLLRNDAGLPLCLNTDGDFDEKKVSIEAGDRLMMYTDGIVEAQSAEGEVLGLNRFLDLIRRHTGGPSSDLNGRLVADVHQFMGRGRFRDDCTLLLLDWTA